MNTKKAILLVSSGTSMLEALENTTNKLEKRLQNQYEDYKIYQAYSVQPIVNMMQKKCPDTYFNVKDMRVKTLFFQDRNHYGAVDATGYQSSNIHQSQFYLMLTDFISVLTTLT